LPPDVHDDPAVLRDRHLLDQQQPVRRIIHRLLRARGIRLHQARARARADAARLRARQADGREAAPGAGALRGQLHDLRRAPGRRGAARARRRNHRHRRAARRQPQPAEGFPGMNFKETVMQRSFLVLAATIFSGLAAAQPYPSRPVTIIVPFAAGGPTDIIARISGEYFSKALGQQFVVENVAGAGGTTGITRGAQAKPDGYTIMMGHMGTHGAAPALYANLKYDPAKDFTPIGLVAGTPILIVARKDFPAANLKEFVAKVKDPAAKVKQAHAGVGSVSFTTCTLLTSQLGTKSIVAAYRGTGPALNDLVGGQVDYMCDQIVNLVEQVKGGSIRAYAIATPERSPALP